MSRMEAAMKPMVTFLVAGLAAACVAGSEEAIGPSEADQAELDAALSGRTAGDPVSCVNQRDLRGSRTIGEGVMLFEGVGGVVWVNRPPGGCPALRFGRAFRTTTPSDRLCRGDIMTVFDPTSGIDFAGCSIGDFVPYRRTS